MEEKKKPVFIIWDEKHSVHNELIDEQHEALVALINEIYASLQTGEKMKTVGATLNILAEYAKGHLRDEVEIMRAVDYPDISEHMKHHELLTQNLRALQVRYEQAVDGIESDMLMVLKEWWKEHEISYDRKYIPYIKDYTPALKET